MSVDHTCLPAEQLHSPSPCGLPRGFPSCQHSLQMSIAWVWGRSLTRWGRRLVATMSLNALKSGPTCLEIEQQRWISLTAVFTRPHKCPIIDILLYYYYTIYIYIFINVLISSNWWISTYCVDMGLLWELHSSPPSGWTIRIELGSGWDGRFHRWKYVKMKVIQINQTHFTWWMVLQDLMLFQIAKSEGSKKG